jgi:hypothetical protein
MHASLRPERFFEAASGLLSLSPVCDHWNVGYYPDLQVQGILLPTVLVWSDPQLASQLGIAERN